jgi:hypothetical protein
MDFFDPSTGQGTDVRQTALIGANAACGPDQLLNCSHLRLDNCQPDIPHGGEFQFDNANWGRFRANLGWGSPPLSGTRNMSDEVDHEPPEDACHHPSGKRKENQPP